MSVVSTIVRVPVTVKFLIETSPKAIVPVVSNFIPPSGGDDKVASLPILIESDDTIKSSK